MSQQSAAQLQLPLQFRLRFVCPTPCSAAIPALPPLPPPFEELFICIKLSKCRGGGGVFSQGEGTPPHYTGRGTATVQPGSVPDDDDDANYANYANVACMLQRNTRGVCVMSVCV